MPSPKPVPSNPSAKAAAELFYELDQTPILSVRFSTAVMAGNHVIRDSVVNDTQYKVEAFHDRGLVVVTVRESGQRALIPFSNILYVRYARPQVVAEAV